MPTCVGMTVSEVTVMPRAYFAAASIMLQWPKTVAVMLNLFQHLLLYIGTSEEDRNATVSGWCPLRTLSLATCFGIFLLLFPSISAGMPKQVRHDRDLRHCHADVCRHPLQPLAYLCTKRGAETSSAWQPLFLVIATWLTQPQNISSVWQPPLIFIPLLNWKRYKCCKAPSGRLYGSSC